MSRPTNCRRIAGKPGACVFKPAGVPACKLEWLNLTLDEFEALRLADLDGLHQEQAAARMRVSRQTFGRIVENARRKVAQVLHSGMALSIEGGTVRATPAPVAGEGHRKAANVAMPGHGTECPDTHAPDRRR